MRDITHKLAASLGRNDEQPNIALAENIVKRKDGSAVAELVSLFEGKNKALKSDAIKVLYEVGERAPELIAAHLDAFIALLQNKENRIVWGAMCAVDAIASARPSEVMKRLPAVVAAMDKGSVITRDHAIKTMVKLAADKRHAPKVMPLLHEQLRTCPVNQLPMYAELMPTITSIPHARSTSAILEKRLVGVAQPPKRRRIEKVLKALRSFQ